MRVWLASFILLFAIAEVYQWAKHFTLPLPIFILGGAFLAIISNYDKYPEITKVGNIKQSKPLQQQQPKKFQDYLEENSPSRGKFL